jgi:hypothetical protein
VVEGRDDDLVAGASVAPIDRPMWSVRVDML